MAGQHSTHLALRPRRTARFAHGGLFDRSNALSPSALLGARGVFSLSCTRASITATNDDAILVRMMHDMRGNVITRRFDLHGLP